jgi:hypothetical protein
MYICTKSPMQLGVHTPGALFSVPFVISDSTAARSWQLHRNEARPICPFCTNRILAGELTSRADNQ